MASRVAERADAGAWLEREESSAGANAEDDPDIARRDAIALSLMLFRLMASCVSFLVLYSSLLYYVLTVGLEDREHVCRPTRS
mmetsp:Transcript_35278/g.77271  ORF Transcript_35278/g.77271 Transcript_35278/m.77271 type:complete len:83 (+) Transcript_35278:1575-1823(+)